MPSILEYDSYKYAALAVMLLAALFAYFKGRRAVSASSAPLVWTNVPLAAFAAVSLGPSAFAILIYLGYKFGVLQPPASGYRFSTFIRDLPLDFAVINWAFVALYVTCRLWPHAGSARLAMWLSVTAMSVPNILLFSLAWTMLANVFDAGQGIGIIEAVLIFPIAAMIWPGVLDAGFGIGLIISTLTAPLPVIGVIGWLAGQAIGWAASNALQKGPVSR